MLSREELPHEMETKEKWLLVLLCTEIDPNTTELLLLMQHTPYPFAQLPWAVPPLSEHSSLFGKYWQFYCWYAIDLNLN